MIRIERELTRTCDGCSTRKPVTLLTVSKFGAPPLRMRLCGACWADVDRGRIQVIAGDVEAVEVQ